MGFLARSSFILVLATGIIFWKSLIKIKSIFLNKCFEYLYISMTSLLTQTVQHSTRPSYRSKINNQPLKKFLSLAVSRVKVVKNGKILTFKVNFLCQKSSESFYKNFHWKLWFCGHTFCFWHFFQTSLTF